jgi:hypothetical protein
MPWTKVVLYRADLQLKKLSIKIRYDVYGLVSSRNQLKVFAMQDQVRQALSDLLSLSQKLSGPERERVLQIMNRFRDYDETTDYNMTLYGKLSSENCISNQTNT